MTIQGFSSKKFELLKKYSKRRKALKDINTEMKKDKVSKAYPNYDYFMDSVPPRDTQKWLQAVRDMYYRVHKGMEKGQALEHVIAGWDKMEKLDFKNWLKFYEENAHKKYKTAQQINYWENANRAGYFVPIYPDPPKQDVGHTNDIDNARDASSHPDISAEEKRTVIEKQRQKIIGRLDSAEKLLRSQEGQLFAGKELETLLDVIYSLKKKIQMVNKISMSTRLYEDMIIREANVLTKKGFSEAGAMLYKIAQTPSPTPPANPTTGGGVPAGGPNSGPGLTPPPGPEVPPDPVNPEIQPMSEGMSEFLEGLETSHDTFIEEDDDESDDLEVSEVDDLVTTAQALPPPPPAPIKAPPKMRPAEIEVTEDELDKSPPVDTFGAKIDQALANATIEDAIAEFEFISNFYKAREIPRRLSRADMILDGLGLASFFPSLAEAQNKALESNNYISSRIEEILSKLQGSIKAKDINLDSKDKPTRPDVAGIKQNLQQSEDKEKARKQMRKDLENEALMGAGKDKPEIEVTEDLSQPATMQGKTPPPPAPVR